MSGLPASQYYQDHGKGINIRSCFSVRTYKLGDIIAEGSYSKVRIAYKKGGEGTKERVACKMVNRNRTSLEFVTKFLPRELAIVQCVSHPYIAKIFDVFDKGNKVYIFMELCDGGDLLQYVQKNGPLLEETVKYFFRQIVSAVAYIHSLDISHRDLKCENVLFNSRNRIKIVDFGFARWCDSMDVSKTFCGSTSYAAPEILQGVPYNPKLYDSWSLGCVLFIMLTSTMPFDETNPKKMLKDQLRRAINFNHRGDFRHISIQAKCLVIELLEPNPNRRTTVQRLNKNCWLKT